MQETVQLEPAPRATTKRCVLLCRLPRTSCQYLLHQRWVDGLFFRWRRQREIFDHVFVLRIFDKLGLCGFGQQSMSARLKLAHFKFWKDNHSRGPI